MEYRPPFVPGCYYHVYNRGNNRENLFFEDRNYAYFLRRYRKYIKSVADTLAFSLMRNHFHLLVRIKHPEDQIFDPPKNVSRQFSNLFNCYAEAINKAYGRSGSLFQKRFRRRDVVTERYLCHLICYVHLNPQRHGFVRDFRSYPYSSYREILQHESVLVNIEAVLHWFGDLTSFQAAHGIFDVDDQNLSDYTNTPDRNSLRGA